MNTTPLRMKTAVSQIAYARSRTRGDVTCGSLRLR
jgi:hypothetical protein